MRACPNLRVQQYRLPDPATGIVYSQDIDGAYLVPYKGLMLRVIASDGLGWDHVSVSLPNRCPTWEELEHVRKLFFRDDETVMQLHVPVADHRSLHPYCLHLWRPQGVEIPRPPNALVGAGDPLEVTA